MTGRRVGSYQRGNHNPYIEGQQHNGQDTKGVIIILISKKDTTQCPRYQRGNHNPYIEEEQQHNGQDTKGVIIILISKKDNNTMAKIPKG